MARGSARAKKPRIRKTAPTVREFAQAAQDKAERAESKSPRRLRPKISLRGHLPKQVTSILSPVGKVLGWLVPKYFVNSWREVRQVNWPNRRETWRLTLAVFIFALVFGVLVAGVDKGLDEVFKKLVLK